MKRAWNVGVVAFIAGFGVATALAAILAHLTEQRRELNAASDVYHPLQLATNAIEESARAGDSAKAAAQLQLLNQRLEAFPAGGPPPADWWGDVAEATTTRPAVDR